MCRSIWCAAFEPVRGNSPRPNLDLNQVRRSERRFSSATARHRLGTLFGRMLKRDQTLMDSSWNAAAVPPGRWWVWWWSIAPLPLSCGRATRRPTSSRSARRSRGCSPRSTWRGATRSRPERRCLPRTTRTIGRRATRPRTYSPRPRQLANLQQASKPTEIQQAEDNLADAQATLVRTTADLGRGETLLPEGCRHEARRGSASGRPICPPRPRSRDAGGPGAVARAAGAGG